jgi:flotillin
MNMLTQLKGMLQPSGSSMADLNSYMLLQADIVDSLMLIGIIAAVVIGGGTLLYWASRYKKCPSNEILVVYGYIRGEKSAKTFHGGGSFIWPVIQSYQYMSLEPMQLKVDLRGALAANNIRINVPSTFTVALDTEPAMMNTAAIRLLGMSQPAIEELASEIIFGQLRLVVAQMEIEEINKDRETFEKNIRVFVGKELRTVGLNLINVNIRDITDEANYIQNLSEEATARARKEAEISIAAQDRESQVGVAKENQAKDIGIAEASRERDIQVADAQAEAVKKQKTIEANRRASVAGDEARAQVAEASSLAEGAKGAKAAEADQRIFVKERESEAVKGENDSQAKIVDANAELAVVQAEATQRAEVADREAEVAIQQAQAKAEKERLTAAEVVREQIDRQKIEIAAGAEAEKTRQEAQGVADAILAKYEAEAKGVRQVLDSKAEGYQSLVKGCGGDARAGATFLMTEKIEEIVTLQTEAIKNIKIDKITVWDSGGGDGGSSTSNFMSNLIKSLPPLHEVAGMAGVELPDYLGNIKSEKPAPAVAVPAPKKQPE